MRLRRSIAALAGLGIALSGCGADDLPTKAEFVKEVSLTAKSEFTKSLTSGGVDEATADQLFEDMVSCVYDKVKDNEDLLRKVSDDSSDAEFNKVMEEKAAPCVEDMTAAVTEAMTGSAG